MKNILYIIIISSFTASNFILVDTLAGQSHEDMIYKAEMLEEGMNLELQNDSISDNSRKADTTSITLGRRRIEIVDKNGDTSVSISERDDHLDDGIFRRIRGFKGNWRGLELGFNNYLNSSFSTSLNPEDYFMELRAARSLNLNLNVLQYNITLSENNIGLVTGLGFEFNNYRFSNNVSITKEDRNIVPVDYDEMGINLDRTRFRVIYLNVPLLMEFQTKHPRRSRRAYFSAGVIGGVNIGSNTRVVYKDNSSRSREKVKDDFYLSPFRYGLSFHTGYRSLNFYANYYPTALFQENKGPELYPFAVGFSILGF